MATPHSLLIPQTHIRYNTPYIHIPVGMPMYGAVIPVRTHHGEVLCKRYDNELEETTIGESRFLTGEYAPMREYPGGVLWASHPYHERVTCVVVLHNLDALVWHGGLTDRDIITVYELRNLPHHVIANNPGVFARETHYNHGQQIIDVCCELFADAWQPMPHNYTLTELCHTLDTGLLKPFPVKEVKPLPVAPPVTTPQQAVQLTLF